MGCTTSSTARRGQDSPNKADAKAIPVTLPALLQDPSKLKQSIGRNGSDIDLTQHDLLTPGTLTKRNNSSGILDLTQHAVPGEYDYIENLLIDDLNVLILPPAEIELSCSDFKAQLSFCGKSRKGFVANNPKKPNQDSIVFIYHPAVENTNTSASFVWAVMDGHGQFGHEVVAFCKSYLERNLLTHSHFHSDLSFAMKDTVMQMDVALSAKKQVDTNFSGTTLVLAALRGSLLVVANVGDSRAILVRRVSGQDELQCEQITTDHKPTLPEEYCRIVAAKGRVTIESSGVGRIYLPTVNMPGLAMSRSVGDRAVHQIGVTAEPQMSELALQAEAEGVLLLLGTDGVFDMVDNASAAAALWDCSGGGSGGGMDDELAAKKAVDVAASEGESCTVALNIDTDSDDGKDLTAAVTTTTTVNDAAAAAVFASTAECAVAMASSLDALLDKTFDHWINTVGLSDDISLIAIRIASHKP